MELCLLVIRTHDPRLLADFYSVLGLTFHEHRHGNSPLHYTASLAALILEIYPLSKGQTTADRTLRLGFTLDRFEETLLRLTERGIPYSSPTTTDFGIVCTTSDPDGRKIDLYKK